MVDTMEDKWKGWLENNTYINILNAIEKYYDQKSANMIAGDYFTPHGSSHCQAVENIIKELITKSKISLTELEKFLLFAAVWTHDIGMFQDVASSYLGDDYTLDKSRDIHDEISAWFINQDQEFAKTFTGFGIEESQFRKWIHTINIICKYHRRKRDINQCPKLRRLSGDNEINIRLVSCLLRFGDTLHVESSRFDKRVYDILQIGDFDRTARLHWLKSYLVSAVNLDIGTQTIHITVDLPEPEKNEQSELKENAERLKFFIHEDIYEDVLAVADTFKEYNYPFYSSINVDMNYCPGYQVERKEEVFGIITDLNIVISPNTSKVIRKSLDSIKSLSKMNFARYELFHNQARELIKNLKKIHDTRPCHVGLGKIITILDDLKIDTDNSKGVKNARIKDFQEIILTKMGEIEAAREISKKEINERATDKLKGKKNILLFGYSEMVLDFLNANSADNFKSNVNLYVFELSGKRKLSITNNIEYDDGIFYATQLSRQGYKHITILPDTSFASLIVDIMANMPLSREQITDLKSFAGRIKDKNGISAYIYRQFSKDVAKLLDEYNKQDQPSEAIIRGIIKELNKIIKGEYLLDRQDFAPILSPEQAQERLNENPDEDILIRINRFAIEKEYPEIVMSGEIIRDNTLLLFGANGIDEQGDLGHTSGHLLMSIVARYYKIPIMAIADKFKKGKISWNPSLLRDKKNWLTGNKVLLDELENKGISIKNYREDRVPGDWIDLVIDS